MRLAPHVTFPVVRRATLAPGMAGIHQTVRLMRDLVEAGKTDPEVRTAAVDVVYLTPQRDELAEVEAVFRFVQGHIRYVRDIEGVETLMTPEKVLEAGVGDCDDKSMLLAAMLEAVGYRTRFVVAGYHEPGQVEHVYVQALARGQWIDLDATECGGLGNAPPDPVEVWTEDR